MFRGEENSPSNQVPTLSLIRFNTPKSNHDPKVSNKHTVLTEKNAKKGPVFFCYATVRRQCDPEKKLLSVQRTVYMDGSTTQVGADPNKNVVPIIRFFFCLNFVLNPSPHIAFLGTNGSTNKFFSKPRKFKVVLVYVEKNTKKVNSGGCHGAYPLRVSCVVETLLLVLLLFEETRFFVFPITQRRAYTKENTSVGMEV
jgi:hypothetical protein